jgi:hypothetical protein
MLATAASTASVPTWIGIAVFAGPIIAVGLAWGLFRLSARAPRPAASVAPAPAPAPTLTPAPAHSNVIPPTAAAQGHATVAEVAAVLAAMADLKPDGEPMTRADVEEYVEAFRAFKQQSGAEAPPPS